MAFRFCETCEKWYDTHEYDVADDGETVCPVEDHLAVVGFIPDGHGRRRSARFPSQNAEVAAERQGLL